MSQEALKHEQEPENGLQALGLTILGVGATATRPLVQGYNSGKSVVAALEPQELMRGIGRMLQAIAGHNYGMRPDKAKGKPAAIDAFDQGDPWKS